MAMAPNSSTLAWKIPWMEEPRRLPEGMFPECCARVCQVWEQESLNGSWALSSLLGSQIYSRETGKGKDNIVILLKRVYFAH